MAFKMINDPNGAKCSILEKLWRSSFFLFVCLLIKINLIYYDEFQEFRSPKTQSLDLFARLKWQNGKKKSVNLFIGNWLRFKLISIIIEEFQCAHNLCILKTEL